MIKACSRHEEKRNVYKISVGKTEGKRKGQALMGG
jgi:hypothetical protein